ncbi:DNA repair protein RecO [Adlercreutzia sp. ZJ473]|uniref:DNA repair protein RecO n=1 Tax=Adlercreutzia sp. ZJ473 TaxID=2722822 RepID=UPI00155648D5
MAAPTYRARALVLRKTKLEESDLILTLLAEDGSQLRAVAKGARKPRSSFASRLELYSEVDLLCARGRSLDVVKEARLVKGRDALRTSVERAAGAACASELVERVSLEHVCAPRLFAATGVALDSLARASVAQVPIITAAHLLKAFSLAGLRPSLEACVACGSPAEPAAGQVRFSAPDGGVVCARCASRVQTTLLPEQTRAWACALIASTFAQIEQMDAPAQAGVDLLQLCQAWAAAHLGVRLKSVQFLLTCGLL